MSIIFNEIKETFEIEGKVITLETGKIARQADGAVIVKSGDTVVLCTVVAAKNVAENADFFPLTVVYQEKTFAAGRIPGGFNKREGKLSDREVLISRLIDRTIRPVFPEGFYNEVQVICTVLSYDFVNEPDILALIGTGAALEISPIPFHGPIAGMRIGLIDGKLTLNPDYTSQTSSLLDLVVGGTEDSILMVESEAKELSEETMLKAINYGHDGMRIVLKAIENFKNKAAKEKWQFNYEINAELRAKIQNIAEEKLKIAYQQPSKTERNAKLEEIYAEVRAYFEDKEFDLTEVDSLTKNLQKHIVRSKIVNENLRIDGRKQDDIRPISTEVGILPRTHGSALFTRGETQAIVVTTLGTGQDEQIVDTITTPDMREHFMLHYNFPPYSVGEVRAMRAPGRREIGHGNLAKRAINPMLPNKADFPYTIRIVSEITESNGSSSMATVCGTSLSLMDAGVPIQKPVAGIAMGLIMEEKNYIVLSDILGDEDYLGDMDFKVAGTKEGVTALQMDIKIRGINHKIMEEALNQAKTGRIHILSEMAKSISETRANLNKHAPMIITMQINKDKIRDIIGPGGKVIKDICEKTSAKIDINDDGIIKLASNNQDNLNKALSMIEAIIAEPEMNKIYNGKVVKITDFGAFVNFMGGYDGLVHISEISSERIKSVNDVLKEGDIVDVKVIGIEKNGKVKLSIKAINN